MSQTPQPTTTAVVTGWRHRIDPRRGLRRVQGSSIAIVQIVVATTGAYALAHYVLGHQAPLLAATVCVSSLGLIRDARPRRVAETVLGMLVGVLVAELLLLAAGSGWWQIALALGLTLVVARFLSAQASFAIAAAIQALIVMVIPADAPFLRLVDGVVGGVAALVVTGLIPRTLRRDEVRTGLAVYRAMDATMLTLAQALRRGDRLRAERGLEKARALQAQVDAWSAALDSAIAIARISPFLRRQRSELQRHERIRQHTDLATRNLRVIGRRAVYLCDDGGERLVAADTLADLARAAQLVAQSLTDVALEPIAREAVRSVAGRLDPASLMPEASLGDQNLIAALRPLAVDLLAATGMTGEQARACIPRI